MMVESFVQQNDGGKLCSTKWWWKIKFKKWCWNINFNIENDSGKDSTIDGGKLGYNKMMVKIYFQQNDGGKLGSTKWWWKLQKYVQQNDGGKLGSTKWRWKSMFNKWWCKRFNKIMVEN